MVLSLFVAAAGMITTAEAAYHQGDQSEDIASIQTQLNALGYNAVIK